MLCPACHEGTGETIRQFGVESAAEHFVPRQRDPRRHDQLVAHLREVLWKQDVVEVHRCPSCQFGFAVPWVGGDAEFYSIIHQANPHYPDRRWEFGVTLEALSRFTPPVRLAEVGAGKGAFLTSLGTGYEVTAADYDEGAVAQLHARGIRAVRGSVGDLLEHGGPPNDAICMFQTLEHMADLDEVFDLVRRLLNPGGSVFLSVPNADATELQEWTTGLWDMPPNHVGRWTRLALERFAERHDFAVAELRLEPVRTLAIAWLFSTYTVNARSYDDSSLEGRINAISSRPVRGALKRAIAVRYVPRLVSKKASYRPLTCWAHLVEKDGTTA